MKLLDCFGVEKHFHNKQISTAKVILNGGALQLGVISRAKDIEQTDDFLRAPRLGALTDENSKTVHDAYLSWL